MRPLWIFFDMGSTLIDESLAYETRTRAMLEGTGIAYEAYLAKRDELGGFLDDEAIAFFGLVKAPWPKDAERPFPDALPALDALRDAGFRLGVIANQSPGSEDRLRRWGLLDRFEVVAASAELGMAKPDPKIFLWALERAGCVPEEAVMVGDRPDNDVGPAKRLGMATVRILRGSASRFVPASPEEEADYTVRDLTEIPELFV